MQQPASEWRWWREAVALEAVEAVMRRYHLTTKRDAVNFALRTVAAEPLALEQALALRGPGLHLTSGVQCLADPPLATCSRVVDRPWPLAICGR